MNSFEKYKSLIERRYVLLNEVAGLDEEIADIESRIAGTHSRGETGSYGTSEIPLRLRDTYESLRRLGGPATLQDITRGHPRQLTTAGVRAQLMKLVERGVVAHEGHGTYALTDEPSGGPGTTDDDA